MKKPNSKYIVYNKRAFAVYEVGEGYFIESSALIKQTEVQETFDSKEDAMYHKLISELQENNKKTIENYKSSKYYKYYIERLKIDNPEYIL